MQKDADIYTLEAGARNCRICNELLPAHETWPGARYRFCGKPGCAEILKASTSGIYIAANEYKCDGPACENFIPTGLYGKTARILTSYPMSPNPPECKRPHTLLSHCACPS